MKVCLPVRISNLSSVSTMIKNLDHKFASDSDTTCPSISERSKQICSSRGIGSVRKSHKDKFVEKIQNGIFCNLSLILII